MYTFFPSIFIQVQMGQSIQEWAKSILWKTAFNNFIWSTLEYFVSNKLTLLTLAS